MFDFALFSTLSDQIRFNRVNFFYLCVYFLLLEDVTIKISSVY